MPIETILTVGWSIIADDDTSDATHIHAAAIQTDNYTAKIREMLTTLREQIGPDKPLHIKSTGRLFRRRTGHFSAIKKFVTASEKAIEATLRPIFYEIDAFSYAFLKGAKNLDAILRESSQTTSSFRQNLPQWLNEIKSLEEFEREGIMPKAPHLAEKYLELRRVLAPASARDERRTLTTLLVSGPSTSEEISFDLGMAYGLSDRLLPMLEQIQVVKGRNEQGAYRYALTMEALPCVLFCLRETMGIDLIEVLSGAKLWKK
jgi:hypothetical protein